jgi:glycosyltransferase involved in cell wall biosynthesis
MKTQLISVIIPVYNMEEYVDRCIKSVVSQSYDNLEIILVDDGSTDTSSELCDAWSHKDQRIMVIHQENQGLFRARISGLEKITGEYFIPIDSDDYIALDYIESLLTSSIRDDADITIPSGQTRFNEQGYQEKTPIPDLIKSGNTLDEFMKGVAAGSYGWRFAERLYKTALYNKSREYLVAIKEHITYGEDILFTTIFSRFIAKVSRAQDVWGYHYLRHSKSTTLNMTHASHSNNMDDLFLVMCEMKKFLTHLGLYETYKEALRSFRMLQMNQLVQSRLSYIQSELNARTLELQQQEAVNQKLLNSKSYKLGRFISKPARILMAITKKR